MRPITSDFFFINSGRAIVLADILSNPLKQPLSVCRFAFKKMTGELSGYDIKSKLSRIKSNLLVITKMKRNHLKIVAVTPVELSFSTLCLKASSVSPDGPSLPPTTKPLSFSISKILGQKETVETVKHSPNSGEVKQIYQYIECTKYSKRLKFATEPIKRIIIICLEQRASFRPRSLKRVSCRDL